MIPLLITYLVIIYIDARDDFERISNHEWIDHGKDTILIAVVYVIVTAVAWRLFHMPGEQILAAVIMLPATRWLLHDFLLNYWRDLPVSYIGVGDGEKDAKTDKLLAWLKIHPLITKGIVWVVSLGLAGFVGFFR